MRLQQKIYNIQIRYIIYRYQLKVKHNSNNEAREIADKPKNKLIRDHKRT